MASSYAMRELTGGRGAPSWTSGPVHSDELMVGSEGEELDPRRRMYSSGGEGGDDDLEYSSEGGGNGSPGRTGSDYYEDDVYSEGDEGSEDPSGAEIVPHSYRPFAVDRPRPVDVWRARHEVEVVVKEPKRVGPAEMNNLVERLTDSARQKQLYVMRVQQRQIAEELKDLKFAPRICKKSRELAANRKDLTERTVSLVTNRERRMMRVRDERDQKELNEATFKPDIKTPCICGKGKGLRESTHSEVSKHTLYCQKFMKSCEAVNKTAGIQLMSDQMQRRVKHLWDYEENKRIRAAQRKQIIQEMEDKELTFSPQINQKSIEILQSEPTPRRALKKSDFGKLKHNQLPGHEQESFRPAINKRSQLASTDAAGVPVYDRLYGEAVTKLVSKKAAITDYTRQFVNTSVDAEAGIDLGVGFHTDLEKAAQATGISGPASSSPAYFNVVRYTPAADFIVRRLQRQAREVTA